MKTPRARQDFIKNWPCIGLSCASLILTFMQRPLKARKQEKSLQKKALYQLINR